MRLKYFKGIKMKKSLFIFFLMFSYIILNAQEWRKVTSASYGPLFEVFMLNENIGWMVGTKGTILKSDNGGNTWDFALSEPLNISNSIYSVYFVDQQNGYFGGSKNLLLKTTDGGNTVDTVLFPIDDKADIKAIYFSNINTGWVLSTHQSKLGKLYYTNDGGITWTVQISEDNSDLEDIYFYSPTKAICVGGSSNAQAIYSTSDGINWVKSPMPTYSTSYSKLDLHAVYMLSETDAIIVGYGSSAVGLQPVILLRSTDGGSTWTFMEQTEENRIYTNLYDVVFKDATTGIAVGGNATTGYVTYKTTDGGTTWQKVSFPLGFTPKSVFAINNKLWIAGSSSGSAYSDDFGNNWKLTTEFPSATLYSLQFVTGNIAYTGGYGGLLMKTNDGGVTWKASYVTDSQLNPTIKDISFVNENVGFLARKNRLVSKTVDGGNTWISILPDTSWNKTTLYGIDFLNENFGIAVGKYGTGISALYKTTDGGNSWDKQIATFDEQLSDVYLLDENNGVVVGRKNVVSYSTDAGNTWNAATLNALPSSSTSYDFNEVKLLNDGFGLACGDILMKTIDGGKVWEYVNIPDLTKEIQSCAIVNNQTWYVTGSKFVFKTTDAGANWIDISDTNTIALNASLNSITVDTKGYPWVAGGTSKIFTQSPLTDVKNQENIITNNFNLEQNYPNPFNPITTIKYSIPVVEIHESPLQNVTLKIFDVLGKEITTLVNERQKPGYYSVMFDGSNLSSGVYFYKLQTGNYAATKKLILIK
jgi:photosystem II stability/assembly factor-like uncharacterized protein